MKLEKEKAEKICNDDDSDDLNAEDIPPGPPPPEEKDEKHWIPLNVFFVESLFPFCRHSPERYASRSPTVRTPAALATRACGRRRAFLVPFFLYYLNGRPAFSWWFFVSVFIFGSRAANYRMF